MYSSESMRRDDLLKYRHIVRDAKREINKVRIFAGLFLAGAMAEGSGVGYVMDTALNNGTANERPEGFLVLAAAGSVGFVALLGGATVNFLEARTAREGYDGTFELLKRLEAGECVPIHFGGGSD